jgi:hypothetical protein
MGQHKVFPYEAAKELLDRIRECFAEIKIANYDKNLFKVIPGQENENPFFCKLEKIVNENKMLANSIDYQFWTDYSKISIYVKNILNSPKTVAEMSFQFTMILEYPIYHIQEIGQKSTSQRTATINVVFTIGDIGIKPLTLFGQVATRTELCHIQLASKL